MALEERFGKYRLLVELGRGGMAEVYLAIPVASDDASSTPMPIVIKRLHPHLAEDPDFVTMFLDEARLAGRLQHPNVVEAYEVGEVGENYFIAMEFLDGQPLRRIQWRAEKEGLAIHELGYAIMVDLLAGLHHAHELIDDDGTKLSVVHRDVTPHNVFVTYDGIVKVVDFGIAKAERRAQETRQGIVKGKVRYMAPEQTTAQTLDRRVDIFAAGVILWEVATGRRLWDGVPDHGVVQRIATNDIPRHPREVNPNVPAAIDEICACALAYSPNDRYASALDMRRALEEAVGVEALRSARRELGPTIAKLFESDRAKLRAILSKQLAKVPISSSTPTEPPIDSEPDTGTTLVRRPSRHDGALMDGATEVMAVPFPHTPPVMRAATPQTASSASIPVVTATTFANPALPPEVPNPFAPPRWKRAALLGVAAGAIIAVSATLLTHQLRDANVSLRISPSAQASSDLGIPSAAQTVSSAPSESSAPPANATNSPPRHSSAPPSHRATAKPMDTRRPPPPLTSPPSPSPNTTKPTSTSSTTPNGKRPPDKPHLDTNDPWK